MLDGVSPPWNEVQPLEAERQYASVVSSSFPKVKEEEVLTAVDLP